MAPVINHHLGDYLLGLFKKTGRWFNPVRDSILQGHRLDILRRIGFSG
jgi:hypothetical protein